MKCPMEPDGNAGWLLDYESGKLDTGTRARLAEHLRDCAACREFSGGQHAVWEALDAWEPAPVSMDFDRRLYQRIEQQGSWWSRLLHSLNPVFRHAVPVGAAAGVVIMAGLMMDRPAAKPVAPVQESAQVEPLQPDQVEHAVDDMQILRDFSNLVRADNANSKM